MRRAIVTLAAAGVLAFAAADARAFNPQPDPPGFGMVGLAVGQTARLSAVRVDNPDFIDNADIRPVTLKLMFLDGHGQVVLNRDGVRIEATIRLMPGGSSFLDLDSRAMIIEGGRAAIRAVIVPAPRAANERSSDPEWIPSLELFSNETGVSSVVLQPGAARYFKEVEPGQPQP